MAKRILVTYATHTGSTVDVAAAIGETLGARGFAADVVPMKDKPRLDGYQAIILGSAVNSGKWLPDAIQFVKANQRALSSVPVTLFSVHIANLGDDERSRQARLAYLDSVRPYVRPVTEVFFAGRFDSKAIGGLGGWLASKFLPSGDLRDWGKIRAWAENVAL